MHGHEKERGEFKITRSDGNEKSSKRTMEVDKEAEASQIYRHPETLHSWNVSASSSLSLSSLVPVLRNRRCIVCSQHVLLSPLSSQGYCTCLFCGEVCHVSCRSHVSKKCTAQPMDESKAPPGGDNNDDRSGDDELIDGDDGESIDDDGEAAALEEHVRSLSLVSIDEADEQAYGVLDYASSTFRYIHRLGSATVTALSVPASALKSLSYCTVLGSLGGLALAGPGGVVAGARAGRTVGTVVATATTVGAIGGVAGAATGLQPSTVLSYVKRVSWRDLLLQNPYYWASRSASARRRSSATVLSIDLASPQTSSSSSSSKVSLPPTLLLKLTRECPSPLPPSYLESLTSSFQRAKRRASTFCSASSSEPPPPVRQRQQSLPSPPPSLPSPSPSCTRENDMDLLSMTCSELGGLNQKLHLIVVRCLNDDSILCGYLYKNMVKDFSSKVNFPDPPPFCFCFVLHNPTNNRRCLPLAASLLQWKDCRSGECGRFRSRCKK